MSQSTNFNTLTEQQKGRITDERNKLVKLNEGIPIGWSKCVYQIPTGHHTFIMRDMFAEVCNVFGVKQVDAKQFVVDVLKAIQLHQNNLLTKQTYATPSIRAIGKCKLPHLSLTTESYWTMVFILSKDSPFVKLMNIKDGEERNGINCFVKELLAFTQFINSKVKIVDDELFITNSIRNDLSDMDLFS